LNLTNVSSAIIDEAKDPPMRTIKIDANKLFFITSPSFPFLYFPFIFLSFIPGSPLEAGQPLICDRRLSPVSGVIRCLRQLI
jgi:hypothetical protein